MNQATPSKCVLQEWLFELPLMQQTVLLTAIRGPDSIEKYHPVKFLLRWYRRCILLSALDKSVLATPYAFGGGSFTGPSYNATTRPHSWQPHMDAVVDRYLQSVDALPHHFQMHFMHAAEILGYKHPAPQIRQWWLETYRRLVHDFHLWPETVEQMDKRLGDNREDWLARTDAATVE